MSQQVRDAVTERKRIASWWVRWNDLNWPNRDGLDRIRERAGRMAEANVSTAMIFGTHFRWDYLPYFTLLHDYLGTVAGELKKCGVELWDHHSVNLVHRYDTREEMRHVMLHSGPHLPFSPSREAAAAWTYRGKRLNDWRMRDVQTGEVLYYPQYAAEGFCTRNPDFVESYVEYVKALIADTGITGLSADDPVHYMHYNSCACPHCRAELKRRTGIELPSIEDRNFWGNWDNPAWKEWIDMRFEATGNFMRRVAEVLPEGFRLTTCGANSASPHANGMASDVMAFLEGCNYANLEMSGNTPPYKHDPVTVNIKLSERLVNASHHQAAAREKGLRCFSTGFGFTKETANIVWAVNKMLDSDCWFSTLKDRLGLPDHILETLPNEWDVIGDAFGYEKAHPELFGGEQAAQMGVYFSYETRKHTYFGNLQKGYYKDFAETLRLLFSAGLSPHTIFSFPKDADRYPLVIVPSAAAMTEEELQGLERYLASGGKVLVTGPTGIPCCGNPWRMPAAPVIEEAHAFFSSVPNGVWLTPGKWILKDKPEPCDLPCTWEEKAKGLYYNPHRVGDGEVQESLLALAKQYCKPMPLEILEAGGYLITVFRQEKALILHMLAADFDTDIDHELDEMRFHRSRVNFVNKAVPIGVTRHIRIKAERVPEVFIPFGKAQAHVQAANGICTVDLTEDTAYLILKWDAE